MVNGLHFYSTLLATQTTLKCYIHALCSLYIAGIAGKSLIWGKQLFKRGIVSKYSCLSTVAVRSSNCFSIIAIFVLLQDHRFSDEIDKLTGYKTKSLLCMPIRNSDGEIIGVAQAINKSPGGALFTEDDEKVTLDAVVYALPMCNITSLSDIWLSVLFYLILVIVVQCSHMKLSLTAGQNYPFYPLMVSLMCEKPLMSLFVLMK